ncbi:MAG TPA: hypothetical protein EYG69_02100 [Campylobacterales bacterium]|nr:hypothetical protein [Campylobacterales bacterium]
MSCQEKFKQLLSKSKIIFNPNSSNIKLESFILLDKLVLIAKDCSHDTIVIGGYTDSDGSESYNK